MGSHLGEVTPQIAMLDERQPALYALIGHDDRVFEVMLQ
jgi:hypothetical protein